MKRTILFVILSCLAAFGQTTNVTATITDSDSIAWANGSFTVTFVPKPGAPGPYVYNGSTMTNAQKGPYTGTMNTSGAMAVSLPDTTFITPSGAQWLFTLCPNSSGPCSTVQTAVSGGAQSFTALFSSSVSAPRFPAIGVGAYGYSDVEVTPTPGVGGSYFSVTKSCFRVWNGLSWFCSPDPNDPSQARKCTYDGLTCNGVTDDGAIINKCIVNAHAAGQTIIRIPSSCRFLITTPINATLFPTLQIIGGGENENNLYATTPTISQGVCNTLATSPVCVDTTGSGKLVMANLSLLSQTSQTQPSNVGVVMGRTNNAGGAFCYAENDYFFNVSIMMDHMAGVNGGAGSVGFYDIGAERATWVHSGTTVDTGFWFAPTNDLGIASPYQVLQTGCPSSMTFGKLLNTYTQVIGGNAGIVADGTSRFDIENHDFVGTSSASNGPAIQFQSASSNNWNIKGAAENFNGTSSIAGSITTTVNLDHMKIDMIEAGLGTAPVQGWFWWGANNLACSDCDLRITSTLNGGNNSQVISNNGTGETWNGGSIEMASTRSPLNASNTKLVGTRVVAWDHTAANVTFNASSNYTIIASDLFGAVGTWAATALQVGGGTIFTGSIGTGTSIASNSAIQTYPWACQGTATAGSTLFMNNVATNSGMCTDAGGLGMFIASSAGTLNNFSVNCITGGVNASSGLFTLQKCPNGINCVDTTQKCTTGIARTCSNTNPVSVVAQDGFRVSYTTQGGETLASCKVAVEKQ